MLWLWLCCFQAGRLSAQSYTGVSDTLSIADSVENTDFCPVRQELPFWFSARGNAEWQPSDESPLRFSVFYVLAKDSLLYVHLSKMGMELVRVLLRADSVFVLLPMKDAYWKGTYASLSRRTGFPLDFQMLQGLLAATPPAPRQQTDTNGLLQKAQWFLSDSTLAVEVNYSGYEKVGGDSLSLLFPLETELLFPLADQRLKWQLKSVRPGVPGPTSFRIPPRYTLVKW